MKSDPFANGLFSSHAAERMTALAAVPFQSFIDQVAAAQLDPASDLQNSDLSGVDFSHSDLSGFNFTGANLRGATGIAVVWDETTVFQDSDIDGSVFAASVRLKRCFAENLRARDWLARVSLYGTTEKILWTADQLVPGAPHNDVALPIAQEVFWRSPDPFLRSQLLFFMAPRLTELQMKELLLMSMSEHSSSGTVVRTSLRLAKQRDLLLDPAIRAMIGSLLHSEHSGIRELSISYLMRTSPSNIEMAAIRHAVAQYPNLGAAYAAETASILGEEYKVIIRHPITRAVFQPGGAIGAIELFLVARRWLKLEANVGGQRQGIPLSQRESTTASFEESVVRKRMRRVVEMLLGLREWGILFDIDPELPDKYIADLPREPKK